MEGQIFGVYEYSTGSQILCQVSVHWSDDYAKTINYIAKTVKTKPILAVKIKTVK